MPELIWEGKYNDNGQIVGPPRVSLPFQTVETVNQSAQERQMALGAAQAGSNPEWRNRLIWGDKKYVLPSLLGEFAGKVNLIYIDPPFATGADFSYRAQIHPDESAGSSSVKMDYQPNLIEQIAYRDTWGGGLDTYLKWMHETLILLRELLAESGSIYVHCDPTAGHYIKAVMDDVLGYDNFRNEIVWRIGWVSGYKTQKEGWIRNHDIILYYAQGENFTFNKEFIPYPEGYTRRDGKKPTGIGMPIEDTWNCNQVDVLDSIMIKSFSTEKRGFPTQKNEDLVERIINASSNEDDLVLDCFVGSGTTAAVAERLGRRWIAADMGRFAISTTRKRLLDIPNVKPFYVQNLGRYERQVWQSAELEQDYREFILQLYRAEVVAGYQWLHGAKAGRMVHVGAVDSPVALDDVQRVIEEFGDAVGTGNGAPTAAGVDILGWDFGLEVDTEARELGQSAAVNVRLLRIPREVMDQKAVNAGDVQFFELAALSVDQKVNRRGRSVTLTIEDFAMPLDGVPDKVKNAVTHWSQWIDYWAVDWDYRNDTFNNQWQSYRTRQDPQLQRTIAHTYQQPGTYTLVVKVIDILGNDTTRRLEVTV